MKNFELIESILDLYFDTLPDGRVIAQRNGLTIFIPQELLALEDEKEFIKKIKEIMPAYDDMLAAKLLDELGY